MQETARQRFYTGGWRPERFYLIYMRRSKHKNLKRVCQG